MKRKNEVQLKRLLGTGVIAGLVGGVLLSGLASGRDVKLTEFGNVKAEEALKAELSNMEKENKLLSRAAEGVGEAAEQLKSSDENWSLALVNAEYGLDSEYEPELTEIITDRSVDSRIAEATKNMLDAAAEDGMSMYIVSAYRSYESQRDVFNETMTYWIGQGYSPLDAYDETAKSVAIPGISEHSTGLALDITSSTYTELDDSQADTPEAKWLAAHCDEYGFILRYPKGKENITGIVYEPWHFRYVGEAAAKEIMEKGITLEEYLQEGQESQKS